ncbi:nonribosomal siderophore peptide synthase SidC [Aspergillus saccharolyticus JOP 1030-1]|uniref:Nonribosomal peptide synthetase sidC n=1 Tax=Aspergillus saccharolyticus JOP 1030-1 TaxID=1450539 RepID=A0A319ACP3_9EURO|nr:nonribosomal siderophore peptide synthase SidC [Aspergillus saccharolyticus JOP 1030-1]PYH49418.1 nonribosomal siderophore peptide synthase SidC [Aspergillus saccharolyticus JOP 1030-1]
MATAQPQSEGHIASSTTTTTSSVTNNALGSAMNFASIPTTRLPALDTVDQYAVEGLAHSSVTLSRRLELACTTSLQAVTSSLIQGYARFISSFTGLDEIAFFVARHPTTVSGSERARGVVRASFITEDDVQRCTIEEGDEQYQFADEVHFYLALGFCSEPENADQRPFVQIHENDFTLYVEPSTNAATLQICFSYPDRLIPAPAADQLLKSVATHLAHSSSSLACEATSPNLSIMNHTPSMIPPSRRHDWNETADFTIPSSFLLHAAFQGWARTKPDAIALDFIHSLPSKSSSAKHSIFTYSDLDQASDNLAAYIRDLLAARDVADCGRVIPVYMTTSPELYISYLGILKAGFAFSPIPQDAPWDRIREILRDIDCPIILGNMPKPSLGPWSTEEQGKDTSEPIWVNVKDVTKWEVLIDPGVHLPPSKNILEEVDIDGDQIAYLLFTSGSTGKPKGVQVSHCAVTCSIASHATSIPLPGDFEGDFRWFQFASPTFDPSLMEIFVTLSTGATLCSADRNLTLTDLEATINEARATIMMATPSLAALLRPSRLTTLQALWTMGEKLNRTVIENFTSTLVDRPQMMLVNAYGPTEGAINCTYLAPVGRSVRGSIIGKALPTCAMFVLDPNSHTPKPVAAGLAGELALGGPQVSKGYLNRPEETAKAFVSSADFGRLYRTGDMARIVWDDSGSQMIEFLGRITSDQVKISGRRLELGEIESVLSTTPGVTEVVSVVTKRDVEVQGSEQIVACFVVSNTDASAAEKQLITNEAHYKAQQHLSTYMCPSAYAFFPDLPRSSSGKVDRKAIVAALQGGKSEIQFYTSQQPTRDTPNGVRDQWDIPEDENLSSVQQLLIELISQTADEDVTAIKPEAGLYALGIDSLGAMRLLQKLRDHGFDGLSVGDVLQSSTPKGLISLVFERRKMPGKTDMNGTHDMLHLRLQEFSDRNLITCAERLNLKPEQVAKVLPTTATQSGMLTSFLRSSSDMTFATRSYIYHTVLKLEPDIDVHRIQKAWDTAVAAYDSFRTVFCWVDDDMAPFAQCILTPEARSPTEWGVYQVTEAVSAEEALRAALRDAEEGIELSQPPFRLSLVRSHATVQIVLSMFHGIFDGGSLQLLLEDVSSIYYEEPAKPRTSLEYVVKHHFRADQTATSDFWNKQLEHHSPVPFPSVTSYRPSPVKSTGCVEVTASIRHDILKKRSKLIGSSPLSVLQAAWGSILLAYSGSPDQDVMMGSVISGRLDAVSEACIGPTFTTIPIRLALEDSQTNQADACTNRVITQRLATLNASALSHLQPGLGTLVTAEGRLPFDTLIAYQDFNAGSNASGIWSSIYHPPMANDFAVMVEVWPCPDSSLTFRASFDESKLDLCSAQMMLRQMSDIVNYILDEPEGNFVDGPLRTRHDFKSSFNPQPRILDMVQDPLLHWQFENHALLHPQDPALIFMHNLDDENDTRNITWSYGELNDIAERLAVHLVHTSGELNNRPIPICIEKSPAMYVAILGILKAGGAWCPIDTKSPAQRRHDLISRTASSILLVSDLDGSQPDGSIPDGVRSIDVNRFIDAGASRINGETLPSTTVRAQPKPDDMAYLIWTSGTTGAPKGVPIKHSSAVSSMISLQSDIPTDVAGGVRCLQFSAYTFDVSIQDIFYTWGVGGVLISATRDIMLGSFARLANVTKATHAHLTPAFSAGISRKSCETLQVITMIGEKLTQSVADDWGTDMRAFNTYGPAEVTVVSTIREFGNEHKDVKSANIGWPMETVSVFVTKDQRLVMKNAVGELALGGPQLSPGYLNQDDITKAKYVWNEEAAQIVYYTGDLVRMLADGSLEYINRVDDLVKLGGIRVELSEISFSLRNCHSLVESVETLLLSRPDRPSSVVVAFLSAPKAAATESQEKLMIYGRSAVEIARAASKQAQRLLPGHMIPSVFLVVSHIPKTSSAKTDRRALQAAYTSLDLDGWESETNLANGSELVAESQVDASVATDVLEIISSLAGMSTSLISKSSRLSSLGIDSIRAIRAASRLKEAGHQVSVVDVLNCVTVRDLMVLVIEANQGTRVDSPETFDVGDFNEKWHSAAAAKIGEDFSILRASPLQESLLTETMGTYSMYWSSHFFLLDDVVDLPRLKQAWLSTCQRTQALRTGFIPVAEVGGSSPSTPEHYDFSILQIVYQLPDLNWKSLQCNSSDLQNLRDQRLDEIMSMHQKAYFRHPPWAVTIFDTGAERTMMFTVHHAIHDEPSLGLILDDVRRAYTYKPPLRVQLTEAFSLILPTEKSYQATNQFWKSELKDFTNLDAPVWPDLTGKRLQPGEVPVYQWISEGMSLTKPSSSLQTIAAELELSSIASIIRAAWCYVSLSYLGLPAAVFAETLSDRVLHPNLEDCIAPLISVVPVPFHPEGSVRQILVDQQRISVQAWKNRHIHARDIRNLLKRQRGEALYPAVFNFHVVGDESLELVEPSIWRASKDDVGLHVEHPMAFNVFQRSDGTLYIEASSDSRIMSHAQLSIFVRQIDALISSMLSAIDEPFGSLVNRLSKSLRSISDQPVSEEVVNSVRLSPTHWLELYAAKNPELIAVEVASNITESGVEKETMTYGELNAEANRVAAYIASLGHRNRMIAVCSERDLISYTIIVGIFKSGNTYLPIDDGLPADRKVFLIEDGSCPIVFTEKPFAASFENVPGTCQITCFDSVEFSDSLTAMSTEDKDYMSEPDDLAYLLYTSGSTGKPKGVMVTRGNLSSFIESFSEFTCQRAPVTLELEGTGRYLAQASRAFDPHLLEMFFPWRHGMATVTAPRPMILNDLGLTISKWEITHASLVPSLVDQSNIGPAQCPSLKYMTVGGEKITQKVLDTWASAPGFALVNAYGPTEATIGCTFAPVGRDTNLRNIGPPLSACVGHVLMPGTLTYALRGQTGELCFTGDLVAKGYLNRPDATGFVTGPNGERMYRTGDIGRLMPDDSVEYLGRGDDQTKIRGQRLELGEVSEVIRSSSSLDISVVTTVAKHPDLSRQQLISFVARSNTHKCEQDANVAFLFSEFATLGKELQDACKRKLPNYMVPELVLPITYIPLAPLSGKANIKELAGLFSNLPLATVLQGNNAPSKDDTFVNRPLSADEQAVAKELCSVVAADPSSIGPLTNIFEIGLDSLSAIGLSIKLRGIGYQATVALVMSNPFVEQLARLPRRSSSTTESVISDIRRWFARIESEYREHPVSDLDPARVAAVRPCLPLQEGLVARSINSEGNHLYVNHIILKLEPTVDLDMLKSAWQMVANDNEILRTAFAPFNKQMVQVILAVDFHEICWEEKEFDSLDQAIESHRQEYDRISQDIVSNISRSPPVRFLIAKSVGTNQPPALFIDIHHALYDGESFFMLMEDVTARYVGEALPPRGSPSEFIEHVCTLDMDKAKDHWVPYLAGYRPTTFRRNTGAMELSTSRSRKLSNSLSDLERCAAVLRTTVPSLVQAVFALLLADTVGAPDVTYGLVLSGRAISVSGASSVLLPCITTVPGRLNTTNLETVDEVIEHVQKSTIRSLEFQHTPLRHIQRWVGADTPLFDCLFSYIHSTPSLKHSLWHELDSHMPAEYPFAVEVEANHAEDTIQLHCNFSSSFGSSYDAEEYLEKMEAVISSVVAGEGLSLANFNLSRTSTPGTQSPVAAWDNSIWSPLETLVREHTADFCGLTIEDVTKGASFLSLGIDSVTAIQFSRRLREAGLDVSSSDVMRFSCIGALAKHIDDTTNSRVSDQEAEHEESDTINVEVYGKYTQLLSDDDSISAMFEATPLQSGMITQTLATNGQVYVYPHPVRLADSVDESRLKEALTKVIERNDILRTSFHLIEDLGSSWIGAVHTQPPLEWTKITLTSNDNILSEITAMYSFRDEASFQAPPIKTFLVSQPEGRILVILLHHALYDGASIPFFFEDLAIIYNGGSPPERPNFSETVKHILKGQDESSKFWTQRLQGYEVSELPLLPTSVSADCAFTSERLLSDNLSTVIEACKAMEVTVQSVSLLAYAKLLARLLGKRDIVFGQVLAGRSLSVSGAENTLGPLFNTVAQRVSFEPKFLSNKAMALRLQQSSIDAQVHQNAPLRTVQNSLRRYHSLTSSSLFDTLFVFQKSADFAGSIINRQTIWTPYEVDNYTAQAEYKLNIEVDHASHGIVVTASCDGTYFTQDMLNKLLDEYAIIFSDIVGHPTRCATIVPAGLGDLPLKLSQQEAQDNEVAESKKPVHEDIVRSILAEVAGVSLDNINPNTSIFSIGLDSLSAIRIASLCRAKGLKTGVADILQGNSLRGISQRIQSVSESSMTQTHAALIDNYEQVEEAVLQQLKMEKKSVEVILPCLGGQYYHLASWLKSKRKMFESAWPYFCTERVNAAKLEEAWFRLQQRHPILRTCFAAISATDVVQIVMKQAMRDTDKFKVIYHSCSITEAAKAQAREEALHPSTLFTPPVRLRLLRATDRDGVLVLINHAAYDAWTMPMFVTELAQLYRGQELASNPDFPAFVTSSLRSLRALDEKGYWSTKVGSATPTLIKKGNISEDEVPDQLFVGAWGKVKDLSRLESTCRAAGISLQAVVLLAVSRGISRRTGVPSPTVGLYQTGRSASFEDVDKLSGPCLNVNPFTFPNVTLVDDASPAAVVEQARAIQSALAERVSYEQSSLRDVLSWTGIQQSGGHLFNAWVNLLWLQNAASSANDTTPDSDVYESSELFLPLKIGVPTDFVPSEPLPDTATSVAALDTSFLPDENVFIDIAPDHKTDSIGFGVRVEGGLLKEEEVNDLLTEIASEIEMIVSSVDAA